MSLVYSTEVGRIQSEPEKVQRPKGDGIVRIQRQTKGRKGKGVSIITGLDLGCTTQTFSNRIKESMWMRRFSKRWHHRNTKGDARDKIKAHLEKKGHTVKLAGG